MIFFFFKIGEQEDGTCSAWREGGVGNMYNVSIKRKECALAKEGKIGFHQEVKTIKQKNLTLEA
jgi:hypothetical protein